ncbi:MAG: YHYH protein [Dehalococcoidia bacterium]|nr:YHYH protein [Dehalococcoidia bacterium]
MGARALGFRCRLVRGVHKIDTERVGTMCAVVKGALMPRVFALLLPTLIVLVACGSGASGSPGSPAAAATSPAAPGTASTTAAPTSSGQRRVIDLLHVAVGDGNISTSARAGYVWRCRSGGGAGGGAGTKGPWFNSDGTYNATAKAIVDGEISWPSSFTSSKSGASRVLSGNALPSHVTGRFPIQPTDDAYQYDRNPNSIAHQTLSVTLPAEPQVASQPSCLAPPFIAVLTSGAVVFDALDAMNRDAGAWETQDKCAGHPQRTGQYHYHTLTQCIADLGSGHSSLLGWAVDGFGLFGVRGERGETLANDDLDACHGHSHEVDWDGRRVTIYHYHATSEYPYTLGCFRGTPARLPSAGGPPR